MGKAKAGGRGDFRKRKFKKSLDHFKTILSNFWGHIIDDLTTWERLFITEDRIEKGHSLSIFLFF